jgi:hypothetical protein
VCATASDGTVHEKVEMQVQTENCALLDYYAARSGNFLPTFRDKLSVSPSGFKNQNAFLSYFAAQS